MKFQNEIIKAVDNFNFLIVVPTSGMDEIYTYFEMDNRCIYVTREEEGVALACGLTLANESVVMLIQQSGVGNLLNAVFTLADPYGIHFPIIVLVRGAGDENPIHWLSSNRTVRILEGLDGVLVDWHSENCELVFNDAVKKNCRWIISYYKKS